MYLVLRILQKLIATLNSDGTPGQAAAGIAIGSVFGLTPLMSLHNLVILAVVVLLRVSLPAVTLGWIASVPVGFALDPLFDSLGVRMLEVFSLRPFWTSLTNAPIVALANLNNSVVLGSLVLWMVASIPLYFLARWGVATYRATVYARIQEWRMFKAAQASKIYNIYRLFRPE
ncbi:MAG: TIGR03546 family protein [Gemmatimonadales bacterium]